MGRNSIRTLLVGFLLITGLGLTLSTSHAQPLPSFSDYAYISNSEITLAGDTLVWEGDAFSGPFHFNSVFRANAAVFTGPVTCAQPEFQVGGQFPGGLTFGADSIAFPDSLLRLRSQAAGAGRRFHNNGGHWQSRITAEYGSFHLAQWAVGAPFDSSNLQNMQAIGMGVNVSIFVEGDLEVVGCYPENGAGSINGQIAIGCSGTMKLLDNVLIEPYTVNNVPYEIPISNRNRVALLAEQDILIADTDRNGRGNGFFEGNGSHDSAHIIITAQMMSTQGQVTFEHYNHPDDPYVWCDPDGPHPDETDERGTVYLRGSIAQRERGRWHTDFCDGTGYGLDFYYDARPNFQTGSFPGTNPEQVVIRDEVTWQDTTVSITNPILIFVDGTLTLGPGTIIEADLHRAPLFEGEGRLIVDGEADNPIQVDLDVAEGYMARLFDHNSFEYEGEIHEFPLFYGQYWDDTWTGLHITAERLRFDLPYNLEDARIVADYIELHPDYLRQEDVSSIRRSHLEAERIVCTEPYHMYDTFEKNVVVGTMFSAFSEMNRCTFIDPGDNSFALILLNELPNQTRYLRNLLFSGYDSALVRGQEASVRYTAYHNFNGENPFWEPVETFTGILEEVDPLFVNPDSGNYHLQPGSPMIDAGASAIPDDPDGTRSDIGAFYFDQLPVGEQADDDPLPGEFAIEGVFPNPFNPTTEIRIALPRRGVVQVEVIDILGRRVATLHHGALPPGHHTFTFNGARLASGTYFVRAIQGRDVVVRKIVLLK